MLAHRMVEIEARLAEVHGHQLRVDVRDVQQRDIAEWRHLVQLRGGLRGAGARTKRRPRHAGDSEELEEFAALQLGLSFETAKKGYEPRDHSHGSVHVGRRTTC